jgi:hypothetical protein
VIGYTDMEGNGACRQVFPAIPQPAKQRKMLRIKPADMRSCGVINVTPFLAQAPHGFFPDSDAAADSAK